MTLPGGEPIGEWLELGQVRYPGVSVEPSVFTAALSRIAPSTSWHELVIEDVFLVTACLSGNPPALKVLDELLARSSRLAAKGLDEAELAQRVRLALLVGSEGTPPKLSQFAGRGALVKWLSAVVQRTALNLARERKPADGDSGLQDQPTSAADPERALMNVKDGAVFKKAFRAALEALPERSRALLRMYYLEGFTADQIAQMHEVHRVSVARWLAQAKRELRAATREKLVNDALSPSHVDSLMRVSNVQFGASLEHACR